MLCFHGLILEIPAAWQDVLKYLTVRTLVSNLPLPPYPAGRISISASLELSLPRTAKPAEKSMHCSFAMSLCYDKQEYHTLTTITEL